MNRSHTIALWIMTLVGVGFACGGCSRGYGLLVYNPTTATLELQDARGVKLCSVGPGDSVFVETALQPHGEVLRLASPGGQMIVNISIDQDYIDKHLASDNVVVLALDPKGTGSHSFSVAKVDP